ncbi:MAG: hypothetical protein J7L94_09185 [Caldisericaceae bacterium]|nr:hypothetical protein [Caldisericaceae bacterium]
MAQKNKTKKKAKKEEIAEAQFPEKVEKLYKYILKSLSWTVGIAFVMVILLPEFNSPFLDNVTRIFYLTGISCLLLFLVIEFFAIEIKKLINRLIDGRAKA